VELNRPSGSPGIAEILGLTKAEAGGRYLEAILRLRAILVQIPGFEEF
jgi:hypothetical protein